MSAILDNQELSCRAYPHFDFGFGVSLAYGLVSLALLYYLDGADDARLFFEAYTRSFKTIISLGLSLGTALIVFRSQHVIPQTIEAVFTEEELSGTDYHYYKWRFGSLLLSIEFSAEFIVVGLIIFYYCQLPLPKRAENLMIIAACAQYALGVYVGRKPVYVGMMLHSLLNAPVTRNMFKDR
jgi:hypothetical protein